MIQVGRLYCTVMMIDLRNSCRVADLVIDCTDDMSDAGYKPVCHVYNNEADQFGMYVLGVKDICNVMLELSVELAQNVIGDIKRNTAKRSCFHGSIWIQGYKDSSCLSYASVNNLKFRDRNTGDVLLDCSGITGLSKNCTCHWMDIQSEKIFIRSVIHRITLDTQSLTFEMFRNGLITKSVYDAFLSTEASDWFINIPLYIRRGLYE